MNYSDFLAKLNNREVDFENGGLSVDVYRNITRMDCTANGVTSHEDSFYIFNASLLTEGKGIRDGWVDLETILKCDELDKVLVIVDSAGNTGRIHAVPLLEWLSGRHTMAGGNFVYTNDGRFPQYPIPVHDRVEQG